MISATKIINFDNKSPLASNGQYNANKCSKIQISDRQTAKMILIEGNKQPYFTKILKEPFIILLLIQKNNVLHKYHMRFTALQRNNVEHSYGGGYMLIYAVYSLDILLRSSVYPPFLK